MKISQMTTDELAGALVRITPPLCRLARHPRTLAALDAISFAQPDAHPPLHSLSLLWEQLLPLFLTDLAEDFFAVVAILTGKDAAELREQNALATLHDLLAAWDQELIGFFTSAGSAEREKS